MNKRQWQTVVFGTAAMVSVIAFGTSRPTPPSAGPQIETAPGQYTQSFTSAIVPKWVLLASLGLAMVTGAFAYRCQG